MAVGAGVEGPELSHGIDLADCPYQGTIAGRVGETPVLVSRIDGEFFAVSGTCTHHGAALAQGLIRKSEVRCPLHHACFDVRTGAVLRAPALDSLDQWRVEIERDRLFVREKLGPETFQHHSRSGVGRIAIVGGGAAAIACAVELRRLGHDGAITILSEDQDPPYDRPNLSKDYLAGTAAEEWMPLRSADWYREQDVELRLGTRVDTLDIEKREVGCASGGRLSFDRLLLATGSEPRTLDGFAGERVFTLRSFEDTRAIIRQAKSSGRAVLLGSSFIALEAAAALCKRGVRVTVVSPEHVPFERVFGVELGRAFQRLHEDHRVAFRLGTVAERFEDGEVLLADGERLPADFVVVGVGVTPRVSLAAKAGLTVENGIWVDETLETSAPGIFAAGDVAAYPDPLTGKRIRVEHWTVAERQGQIVAANMLGARQRFESVPFFWTEQHGVTLRYTGYAPNWDEIRLDGKIGAEDCIVRYYRHGKHCASATINRDHANLEDELSLEPTLSGAC
jgi:apoptosis-inducing factor 3